MVHRKLTRTADHHSSLLRNLITNLLEHESITTTHAKAKEAQTAVERVITAAKHLHSLRGSKTKEELHRRQQLLENKFYKPEILYPKLMSEIVARYADFNGGYTRVLRLEPRLGDRAPQSILELAFGSKDMRFALTAKAVARAYALGEPLHPVTTKNMKKLTKTEEQKERFEAEVQRMKDLHFANIQQGEQSIREVVSGRKRAPIDIRPNPLAQ